MPRLKSIGSEEWNQLVPCCSEAVQAALQQMPQLQNEKWKVVAQDISLRSYEDVMLIVQLLWERIRIALGLSSSPSLEFQADWAALWEYKKVEVWLQQETILVKQEQIGAELQPSLVPYALLSPIWNLMRRVSTALGLTSQPKPEPLSTGTISNRISFSQKNVRIASLETGYIGAPEQRSLIPEELEHLRVLSQLNENGERLCEEGFKDPNDFVVSCFIFDKGQNPCKADGVVHLPGSLFEGKNEGDVVYIHYKGEAMALTLNQSSSLGSSDFKEVLDNQVKKTLQSCVRENPFFDRYDPRWWFNHLESSTTNYCLIASKEEKPQLSLRRLNENKLPELHSPEETDLGHNYNSKTKEIQFSYACPGIGYENCNAITVIVNKHFLILYAYRKTSPDNAEKLEFHSTGEKLVARATSSNPHNGMIAKIQWDNLDPFKDVSLEAMKASVEKGQVSLENGVMELTVTPPKSAELRQETALVKQEQIGAEGYLGVMSLGNIAELQQSLVPCVPVSFITDAGSWQLVKAEDSLQAFAHLVRYPSLSQEKRTACRQQLYKTLQTLGEAPIDLRYWTGYCGEEIACYHKKGEVVFVGRGAVGSTYFSQGKELVIQTKEEQAQCPPLWTLSFTADGRSTFVESVWRPAVMGGSMEIICCNNEDIVITAEEGVSENLLGKFGFRARHKAAALTEFILFKMKDIPNQEGTTQRLVQEWCQFLRELPVFSVQGETALIPAGQEYAEVRLEKIWSPVAASEDCTFVWTFRRYRNGDVAVILQKSTTGRSMSRGSSERCLEISVKQDAPNQIHFRKVCVNGNEWICTGEEASYTLFVEEGKLRFSANGKDSFEFGTAGIGGASGQQTDAEVQQELAYILKTLSSIDDIRKSPHTVVVKEQDNQETQYYDLSGREVPREFVLGQLAFQQGTEGAARPYGTFETYLALYLREVRNQLIPQMTYNNSLLTIAKYTEGAYTEYRKLSAYDGQDITGLTASQVALLNKMANEYRLLDPKESYFWVTHQKESTGKDGSKKTFDPKWHRSKEIGTHFFNSTTLVELTEGKQKAFVFADFLANVHDTFKYTEIPIPDTAVFGRHSIKNGNSETLFQVYKVLTIMRMLYVFERWTRDGYQKECQNFVDYVNKPDAPWHQDPGAAYDSLGRYKNLDCVTPLEARWFIDRGFSVPAPPTEMELFFGAGSSIWYTPRLGVDHPFAVEIMAFCLYQKAKMDPFFREGLKIIDFNTRTVIQLKPGCLFWGSDDDGQGRNYLGQALRITRDSLLEGREIIPPTEEMMEAHVLHVMGGFKEPNEMGVTKSTLEDLV